jgi:hypothetical protein
MSGRKLQGCAHMTGNPWQVGIAKSQLGILNTQMGQYSSFWRATLWQGQGSCFGSLQQTKNDTDTCIRWGLLFHLIWNMDLMRVVPGCGRDPGFQAF